MKGILFVIHKKYTFFLTKCYFILIPFVSSFPSEKKFVTM
ncbi:hypothetical protein BCE_3128 [Bacillus cereus ATCC 10987]|uniref:Uncharacterized protein n=1 Tax=Bacillus cereus (strain ATCC 10987 / NRS 248) TaxID=222523 RepID=Q735M4_BACC1|nr:hypothetical protein BCE_3128 [Bacillus cereus ATCC 10987]